MRYVCDLCGYVYDEDEGEIDKGIEPGTAWDDLPEDYEGPICVAGKEQLSVE